MERLVLVHGSVVGGRSTWRAQLWLGDRYELLIVDRPGFAPHPPVDRVDFETDADLVAELLRPGDRLVGHSYGGVISLLAAALVPELVESLTVIEPPATRIALDNPAVAAFAARGAELYATAQADDPETFLRSFLAAVLRARPAVSASARARAGCQGARRRARPAGGSHPSRRARRGAVSEAGRLGRTPSAFDAICDVLESELGAVRAVLEGFGHTVQLHPQFNDVLVSFVERARAALPADGSHQE